MEQNIKKKSYGGPKEKIKVMFQKQAAGLIGIAVAGTILICMGRVFWALIKFLFITHA